MRALLLTLSLCSFPALAAETLLENAYFLLVGATDQQMAACPSPVAIKKDTFRSGAFLKAVFPAEKIEAAGAKGEIYTFSAGARTITIKVISASEFQWDEKAAKDFTGKLCRKAMYATNAANQEQLDSLIPDEEIQEKDPAAAPAKNAKTAAMPQKKEKKKPAKN